MSKIEDSVCAKIQERAKVGLTKYGVTLERTDLTEVEWLTHLQEELMDACGYLERILQMKQAYTMQIQEPEKFTAKSVKAITESDLLNRSAAIEYLAISPKLFDFFDKNASISYTWVLGQRVYSVKNLRRFESEVLSTITPDFINFVETGSYERN
jgi:hypothetical protein